LDDAIGADVAVAELAKSAASSTLAEVSKQAPALRKAARLIRRAVRAIDAPVSEAVARAERRAA
jgi:hypothetical protein